MSTPIDPRAVGPRIRMMMPDMSPFEGRITEFLMRTDFDDTLPLKQVASASGVSEAMVVKTAKKLGFDGFRGLRAALVEYKRLPAVDLHQEVTPEDSAEMIVQKVFRTSIQALEETLAILNIDAFKKAARLIHTSRQRDFYGLGGSAQIARDVAHKFLRIGIRTSVFDDSHMMAMSANLLGPGDLAIAFSHSGRSSGLVDACQFAKANGASIIAVSNYDTGPIAEMADVVLCSTAQGSPLTGENAAARIAQLNIMDAVFVAVAQMGYATAEQNLSRTMAAVHTKRK
jgi:RpiR family transcriptional regulator, repressor of rpiB and als operon